MESSVPPHIPGPSRKDHQLSGSDSEDFPKKLIIQGKNNVRNPLEDEGFRTFFPRNVYERLDAIGLSAPSALQKALIPNLKEGSESMIVFTAPETKEEKVRSTLTFMLPALTSVMRNVFRNVRKYGEKLTGITPSILIVTSSEDRCLKLLNRMKFFLRPNIYQKPVGMEVLTAAGFAAKRLLDVAITDKDSVEESLGDRSNGCISLSKLRYIIFEDFHRHKDVKKFLNFVRDSPAYGNGELHLLFSSERWSMGLEQISSESRNPVIYIESPTEFENKTKIAKLCKPIYNRHGLHTLALLEPNPSAMKITNTLDPWMFYGILTANEELLQNLEHAASAWVEELLLEQGPEACQFLFNSDQFGRLVLVQDILCQRWKRCKILKKNENHDNVTFDVFLVDYGGILRRVRKDQLMPITPALIRMLPFQAIALCLAHVRPLGKRRQFNEVERRAFWELICPDTDTCVRVKALRLNSEYAFRTPSNYYQVLVQNENEELGMTLVSRSLAVKAKDVPEIAAFIKSTEKKPNHLSMFMESVERAKRRDAVDSEAETKMSSENFKGSKDGHADGASTSESLYLCPSL